MLGNQRNRWQRGRSRCSAFTEHDVQSALRRRRHAALPYYLIFEALGPVIELSGYIMTSAVCFGLLDWRFAELLFLLPSSMGRSSR